VVIVAGALATIGAIVAAPPLTASALSEALTPPIREARRVAREIGVHVVDAVTGESVVSVEPDLPRIVASNTKLFTTAAALDSLGPGYLYETRLMMRGKVLGNLLVGDLGVVAGGDPNISGRLYGGDPLAVFRRWATRLKELGATEITGDIHLANGLFDLERIHPDWPRDQLDKWYEAPVDALSFSDNCVLVRVWPGRSTGSPPRVELVPDVPVVSVRNIARTISSRRGHRVAIYREPGSNEVVVGGKIYRRARPVEAWITVPDPQAYFGQALRKAFADEGIKVRGQVELGRTLPMTAWRPLAVHRTDMLTTLEVINRRSQNFYAESLLKLLGAELCQEGSWQAGMEVVGGFIDQLGVPKESYRLADGSGMSRNNLFTPRQITRLLVHMYHHPLADEFVGSLPVSGTDYGRWKTRLATPPYGGNVMAKTGTLRAVSALSGYVRGLSGRTYAFSILFNRSGAAWNSRTAQDKIIRALIDNG
jgi:D-alanyl-D-alanine carboxypeptidase/D-alanyl-D-alanine-endopeptidase (penicillin-binding protein 4)